MLGTGNSGHDVAQDLFASGADVSLIQRSPTYVISVQEAQSVYAIYTEGIPIEDCDLLATATPYPVLVRAYQLSTAASRAAKHTGLVMLSHTENCTCGHDQVDIVTGECVAASRLVVGHCCGRDDHEYQAALARRGAYVGFDRFGIEIFNSDTSRTRNVKQMIDAGLRDHVLLSHDTVNCWMGGVPGYGDPAQVAQVLPNWKLTHLFENIFPALRGMGVSDADLDHIVTDNPRRWFAQ